MAVIFTLFRMLKALNVLANRHAGALLAAGLVAVALHNWRQWRQDKAFLAQRRAPEPLPPLEQWPDLPLVSVLVAAWNEAAHIERHIASFRALRYPHKELVLCAGGEDGTYELALRQADPDLRVLRQEAGEGKQRALARAFRMTQGAVIFLTDADCLLADEPFERTLCPMIGENELAVTGGSQPLPEQLADPFVFTQAASQIYSALHSQPYAAGILGRNCAVRRNLLAKTAALESPAPTGTDYVLAKTLDKVGVRVRQMPESRMATAYPTTAYEYLRQQRRWLRNVVVYGCRFNAYNEVRASLRTSVVGVTMLVLPVFGVLIAPWFMTLWGILAGNALLARMRYLSFAGAVLNRKPRESDVAVQAPLLMLDFVAWAQPLIDYVHRGRQSQW